MVRTKQIKHRRELLHTPAAAKMPELHAGALIGGMPMKIRYSIPLMLSVGLLTIDGASAMGTFSYQKQWWPKVAMTPHGYVGSGAAYDYAGPSGPDLWNDPRAWWLDYQQGSSPSSPTRRYGH